MFPGRLVLSLVFAWSALCGVESRPSTSFSVELSTCGGGSGTSSALVEQCTNICQPIREAQDCNWNAACTCSVASPAAVQACLQCHLDANQGMHSREVALVVPSRLSEYSELCGVPSVDQPHAIETDITISVEPHDDAASRNSTDEALTSRSEIYGAHCLYGLPQLAAASPAAIWEVAFEVI
ncbi:uncharacterized protein FIBRA_04363 [Fibroporia radiculosa]|uniref:Extracellular membrane protein CFEM domain-containing protein n=1 Tax=Fibroporia radiculosa TaxID=599839 RepID=J4G790_9APHY|nr:uncharacterized protein FIBRA_04363 [Fibroporia radiculosa]CCM02278.1 predicted protein [Fibroporia radiculosa]